MQQSYPVSVKLWMRGMVQVILMSVLVFCSMLNCRAQSDLPTQPGSNEVVYQQTFQLSASLSDDDINALLKDWFNQNPGKFTSKNENSIAENMNSKGKDAVDRAFDNSEPLQSLDPSAKRATGRGIIKYYGGGNTC